MKEKCYRYKTPYGVFDCVLQEREKLFYNFFIKDGENVVVKGMYAGYIKDLGQYLKTYFPALKTYADGKHGFAGKAVERKRQPHKEVYYFGKPYQFTVLFGAPSVKIVDGSFIVSVPDGAARTATKIFSEWWKRNAEIKLVKRAEELFPLAKNVFNFEENIIFKVTEVKGYWGNYNWRYRPATMRLNSMLMQAEPYLIDWVIMHEFAHVRHHNHSKEFHNDLRKIVPKEREYAQKIKKYSTLPFNLKN